jgi:hypothetical protein
MASIGKVKNCPTNFVSRDTLIPITVMARRVLSKQKIAYVTAPRSVRSFMRNLHLPLTLLSRTNKSSNNSSAREMPIPTVSLAYGTLASKKPTPVATSRSVSTVAGDVDPLLTLPSGTHKTHQMSGATSPTATATTSYTSTANTSISNKCGTNTPAMSRPSLADDADARKKDDSFNKYVTGYDVGSEEDEEFHTTSFSKSLGPQFQSPTNLVTYSQPSDDESRSSDLDAAASVSEFDYQGENADYKHERRLYEKLSGIWAELAGLAKLPHNHAYLTTEMSDGSKWIMSLFHNAYYKQRTGQSAFEGYGVSNSIMRDFQDAACDISDELYDRMNQDEEIAYRQEC